MSSLSAKPLAPPPVKPTPPKPATVAGINRPAPPPVTVIRPPPSSGGDTVSKKAYERQADCAKCNNPIRYLLMIIDHLLLLLCHYNAIITLGMALCM